MIEGPGYEHLLWHSDCAGYYVPVPLSPVVALPETPRWDWQKWSPWVGSPYTLLKECRLADVLPPTPSEDPEALREYHTISAADWRRYALECFTCRTLIAACEVSVRTGCALVFC